ncbi:MAG: biotin--[acetyl-CoA-carboxylase] ligase [Oscillospiraceae bacterium]|nr:biotin--[acetyl-CoA-carboxylase] ligase [Oscillospiraceae bacterium]
MVNVIYLNVTDSTNNYLKAHCSELSDGTTVTAERQSAGRGRRGHGWSTNAEMLPLSVLLKDPPERETLTARVGLAVCDAIGKMYEAPPKIGIKWPNDIIAADRKVCGILCESVFFGDNVSVICGIGVNLSQSEEYFRNEDLPHAGSLLTTTGAVPERDRLLREIAASVARRAKMPFSECYEEYKSSLVNLGKTVRIIGANGERTAFAEDVAQNGFLICRDENGLFEVNSGEVSVRGENGYI